MSDQPAQRATLPVRGRVSTLTARGGELFDRLRQSRLRAWSGLAIFLGINLILLALYIWSRGGQTIHVQLLANGDEFRAYIDGKEMIVATFDAPEEGSILVLVGSTEETPSLPSPRGLDSIRVTDLSNNAVLFEDDFSDGISPEWRIDGISTKDGVLHAQQEVRLRLPARPWRNYVVDLEFKNLREGAVMVRSQSDDSGVAYGFRPFRHYDNGLSLIQGGQEAGFAAGPPISMDRTESVRSLVAMALGPYPQIFLFLAGAGVLVGLLQFARAVRLRPEFREKLSDVPWFVAAGLAAFGLVTAAYINYSYGDHMPHVPDELAYIFQAKLLASFDLTAPVPPVSEAFDYFYPPFIIVHDGHWMGLYSFGHPIMLAFGDLIGALWLIPALLGAATVLLVFAIGRKVYSGRVGLLAALVFATSPFFLMTASNYMSHNTAAFYLAGAVFCIAIADRRPFAYGVLGGALLGLLFNTQSLVAVAVIPPIGALLFLNALPQERRRAALGNMLGFAVGGAALLLLYFGHNLATTGDALESGLHLGNDSAAGYLGFGGRNSVAVGIQNQQAQLSALLLVLNGWPMYVGLMFVLLAFVLATRHLWDWLLLVAAVAAMGAYVLFIGHGIMHGPRYWYAVSPLLALLTARGADRAAEVLSTGAAYLRERLTHSLVDARWAGVAVVYAAVLALVGSSIYTWLLGHQRSWVDEFIPERASAIEGFNRVDDRLVDLVEEADLENALVLVQADCNGWQCYGSVFWLNSPYLDGDVVFARNIPERQGELFEAYPDRLVYVAEYSPVASLAPFGNTPPREGEPAPRASDIDVPRPTPTPTPDPGEAVERDEQRIADLEALVVALQDFHDVHGTFPLAEGLQSVCRYQDLDSACQLTEVLNPLPQDPDRERTYYYYSTGQSFTLWALLDAEAPDTSCPVPEGVTPDHDPAHLYCVQGTPD
jgi:4-amino-4-deoxy-L-arabinose transferase-like glycosyltransferase